VRRLVEADVAGARHAQAGDEAPPLGAHRGRELDAPALQLCKRGPQIVAHQVQTAVTNRPGVDGELTRRQSEDQPAAAGVDGRKLQHLAEERPRRLGVLGVKDRVGAPDHGGIIAHTLKRMFSVSPSATT
jgi:hypothetical protein